MYRFRFTEVRFGPYDGIQLGGLALLDVYGRPLAIESIENPGGDSPMRQQADRLIDYQSRQHAAGASVAQILATNTGKWFDDNFNGSSAAVGPTTQSFLIVTLSSTDVVGGYRLLTAPDVRRRDPVSWTLEGVAPDGTSRVMDTVSGASPPDARGALYPASHLNFPPPSMP